MAACSPCLAQHDEHSLLIFRCGGSGAIGCSYQYIYNARPPYDTINGTEVMPMDFDYFGKPEYQNLSFTFSDTSYHGSFEIDTTSHLIRNLTVSYEGIDPSFRMFTVGEGYILYFDTIHYDGNFSDTISVQGDYLSKYQTSVGGGFMSSNVSGSDSGEIPAPITIDFPAKIPSSVSTFNVNGAENFKLSYSSSLKLLLVSFPFSADIRKLTLFDPLGVLVCESNIPSGIFNKNVQVTLSPGCYFARLGGQVAKFVVLPR